MQIENSDSYAVIDIEVSYDSYEEEKTSLGITEYTSLKTYYYYTVWVSDITLPSGNQYEINTDLSDGEKLSLEDYVYEDDYRYSEIDIWPLTKEKLGLSTQDILKWLIA